MRRAGIVALGAVALVGCGEGGGDLIDAAADADAAPLVDGLTGGDGQIPLTWVDFAVTGCRALESAPVRCLGYAPLEVRFVTLSPAPVATHLWSFGDGSGLVTDPSPVHTFRHVGAFTVSLTVGGPGGTAQAVKEGFVVVEPAPLGGRCRDTSGCEADLECICPEGEGCPGALAGGLCAKDCGSDPSVCPPGAICADLAPDGASGGPGGWRRPLCLARCDDDADCAGGLRCRELRAFGTGGWGRGCFAADLLVDEGSSCVDADGQPDHGRCASGRCLRLGARGLCAGDCSVGADCPSYAACATFTSATAAGAATACLARCGGQGCDTDPWLRCEAPSTVGDLGFTVGEAASPGGYCAPERCANDADCGAGARCVAKGDAKFCDL